MRLVALIRHALLAALLFVVAAVSRAADFVDAPGSWSTLGKLDLEKLATGKAVMQCNSSMKFPRGLSAQAAFLVSAPVDVTLHLLIGSDPTKHADLDIYQHHRFQGANDAAFEKLTLDPQIKAVRNLLGALPKGEDLQLMREEAAKLPKNGERGAGEQFWIGVLRERWNRAASRGELGGADQYDTRGEIKTLLAEEAGIAQHFEILLTPLTKPTAPLAPASYYWQISNVNNLAACSVSAIYAREVEKRRQVLDVTFFVSSGYLTSVMLYELVPLTRGGKPCTLVWQGCLVSAPGLAGAFGLKRKIASILTLNDLERSIRLLQQDAARASNGAR